MFESENELRRIRIMFVWIVVFLLFGVCSNYEMVVMDYDGGLMDIELQIESMVQLEYNYFGVVEDGYMKIYCYDEKMNKIKLKKEMVLDEFE